MKKTILLYGFLHLFLFSISQNVGVGTATPTEKLYVNGNLNIAGQLKVNGSQGTTGQVLRKDASNNPVWGDISEFKNMMIFDCTNIAFTAGNSNCSNMWAVPAGVTTIFVECWGGGGGGGRVTGGGGGGYIAARLTVTPATSATLTIGAGGNYAGASANGIYGGNTSFVIGGVTLGATGGSGGLFNDPQNFVFTGQNEGGGFVASGISNNFIGFKGQPGGISRLSYVQVSTTEFAKVIHFGDGGDAAMQPNSGAKGGYKMDASANQQSIFATGSATMPGGGGGADHSGGFYGLGGRIIIRW